MPSVTPDLAEKRISSLMADGRPRTRAEIAKALSMKLAQVAILSRRLVSAGVLSSECQGPETPSFYTKKESGNVD